MGLAKRKLDWDTSFHPDLHGSQRRDELRKAIAHFSRECRKQFQKKLKTGQKQKLKKKHFFFSGKALDYREQFYYLPNSFVVPASADTDHLVRQAIAVSFLTVLSSNVRSSKELQYFCWSNASALS